MLDSKLEYRKSRLKNSLMLYLFSIVAWKIPRMIESARNQTEKPNAELRSTNSDTSIANVKR